MVHREQCQTALFSFSETIFGLWQLIEAAIPVAHRERSNDLGETLVKAMEDPLTEAGLERLREFKKKLVKSVEAFTRADGTVEPRSINDELVAEFLDIQKKYARPGVKNPHGLFMVINAIAQHRPEPAELLGRATVTSAVGAFEALMSTLLAHLMELDPKRLSEGKEFSLADIVESADRDELIAKVIDRKIDALLRGGLSDWVKWLKTRSPIPIDLASIALGWPATQEAFKRRNAIVHTGSRVNDDYRALVGEHVRVGELLKSDSRYVNQALENLLTLGAALSLKVWAACESDAGIPNGNVGIVAVQMGQTGWWKGSARLHRLIRSHCPLERGKFEAQIFEWHAMLQTEARDDLIKELSTRSLESFPIHWKFATAALLGQVENALLLLPEVLDGGEISISALRRTRPYEALQKDARFIAMVGDYERRLTS